MGVVISDLHPSKYYVKKTLKNEEADGEKQLSEWFQNTEYDQKPEGENQYLKTIARPTEDKLKDKKPISDPLAAFGSILPPGGELYAAGFLLGKRELDANVDLREGTPVKQLATDNEPFGLLHQNTLEKERRPIPKYDKEKNITLTPKTKEEEERYSNFLNVIIDDLAKTHNMDPNEVFKFVMSMSCETISFEKVHHALLKAGEQKQPQPKKQIVTTKRASKTTAFEPIR